MFSANSLFAHNYNFQKNRFKLKYAPHLGMFANSAGKDPIDQLSFMADQGFMAFEDNRMKSRSISTQNQMSAIMEKRNIEMGVFVAHDIYWQTVSYTHLTLPTKA